MGSEISANKHQLEDKPFYTPVEWAEFNEQMTEVGQGTLRNIVKWIPKDKQVKGVVLICHGLHEHSLRYSKVANALTRKGFVVASIDHKGHGLSEGVKGLIDDWTVLPRDFTAFARVLHEEYPKAPFFVFAHSMGTLVATVSLKDLPFVKAFSFSGCAIDPGPDSASPFGIELLYPINHTPLAFPVTAALAAIAPQGPLSPLRVEGHTTDKHEQELIYRDGRRYPGYVMDKTVLEFLKLIAAAKEEAKAIKMPFLCLHGASDRICLPAGSEYFMKTTATPEKDKTLVLLPGLRHDPLHEAEPHSSDCISKVTTFFEEHC